MIFTATGPKRSDFCADLAFSRGTREATDMATIQKLLDGCVGVTKATADEDRAGVDYFATLRRGARVRIDAKARRAGCSKYWKNNEPDLALEIWSVLPAPSCPNGRTGWTLDEGKEVDMILFTFDSSDTHFCFLIGFQTLRLAFRRNVELWSREYGWFDQNNSEWTSRCVFVPESVLSDALTEAQKGVSA